MEISSLLLMTALLSVLILFALLIGLAFKSDSSFSGKAGKRDKVSQDLKRIKEQIEK